MVQIETSSQTNTIRLTTPAKIVYRYVAFSQKKPLRQKKPLSSHVHTPDGDCCSFTVSGIQVPLVSKHVSSLIYSLQGSAMLQHMFRSSRAGMKESQRRTSLIHRGPFIARDSLRNSRLDQNYFLSPSHGSPHSVCFIRDKCVLCSGI